MTYLLYTEVPLDGAQVQQHLSAMDKSAPINVIVPIRSLNEGEMAFVETEHSGQQSDETPERIFATWRLRQAIEALRERGFETVEGLADPKSPIEAIENAVTAERYDAVVVVTEPVGVAGWVNLDLAHRVERHVDEPVIHIELDPAH